MRNAGMQTLSSLRLEKAYRDFGVDVDNTDNPIEAGLGFAVRLDKPGGFIGRDALAAIKARGYAEEAECCSSCSGTPNPCSMATRSIYLEEWAVGHLQVGAYGHTLGGAVGIGFASLEEPITASLVERGSLGSRRRRKAGRRAGLAETAPRSEPGTSSGVNLTRAKNVSP